MVGFSAVAAAIVASSGRAGTTYPAASVKLFTGPESAVEPRCRRHGSVTDAVNANVAPFVFSTVRSLASTTTTTRYVAASAPSAPAPPMTPRTRMSPLTTPLVRKLAPGELKFCVAAAATATTVPSTPLAYASIPAKDTALPRRARLVPALNSRPAATTAACTGTIGVGSVALLHVGKSRHTRTPFDEHKFTGTTMRRANFLLRSATKPLPHALLNWPIVSSQPPTLDSMSCDEKTSTGRACVVTVPVPSTTTANVMSANSPTIATTPVPTPCTKLGCGKSMMFTPSICCRTSGPGSKLKRRMKPAMVSSPRLRCYPVGFYTTSPTGFRLPSRAS